VTPESTSPDQQQARRRIVNRLRRARGQFDALIVAVEEGSSCREVLTQLSALSHALNRAGFAIVISAMQECLINPDQAHHQDGMTTEELEKLFLSLS
jgi:DNA-binding FrmR family transcriptional regulator